MCGTAGAAIGTITSGWLVQLQTKGAKETNVKAYRIIFVLYAALGALKLLLVLLLSPRVELAHDEVQYQEVIELEDEGLLSHTSSPRSSMESRHQDSTPQNRPGTQQTGASPHKSISTRILGLLPQISSTSLLILLRLIALFSLDSFASGMAAPSWLTYFFTTYHKVDPGILGTLFFTTNILATLSNFAALPLARRLGPLKTMTFTHLPSAILLGLVAMPSAGSPGTLLSMAFLSLRACTQSMDQAPRQAFLAAVMKPEERTAILGVINIVKTLAQAGGIGVSGVLAAEKLWRVMFGAAGLMKVSYDVMILWTFLHLPDREDAKE